MSESLLTPLPSFNQLVAAVEEQSHEGLVELQAALDQDLAHVIAHFNYEVRFAEETPVLVEVLPEIYRCFNAFEPLFQRLTQALEQGHRQHYREILEGPFHRKLRKLYQAFDRLRQQPEKSYCESPYYNALLKAGHMYLEGRLEAGLVLERLDPLLRETQMLLSGLSQPTPPPGEEGYLKEHGADLYHTAEDLLEALLEIEQVLVHEQSLEPEHLGECFDAVAHLADELVVFHQELKQAQEESLQQACFKCGSQNATAAKVCEACGAAMPTFATEQNLAESEVDVRLEDGIVATTPQRPELVGRLLTLLEQAEEGRPGVEELEAEVRSSESRLGSVRRQLERMSAHDHEVEQTQERIRSALDELSQGLELVEGYLKSRDPSFLRPAMAALEPAGQRMVELMTELTAKVAST